MLSVSSLAAHWQQANTGTNELIYVCAMRVGTRSSHPSEAYSSSSISRAKAHTPLHRVHSSYARCLGVKPTSVQERIEAQTAGCQPEVGRECDTEHSDHRLVTTFDTRALPPGQLSVGRRTRGRGLSAVPGTVGAFGAERGPLQRRAVNPFVRIDTAALLIGNV